MTIKQLLDEIHLHDSTLQSLTVAWNGTVTIEIDIDEIWNEELDPSISGIIFPSVYEIVEYKIDRMNIIDNVEVVSIEEYDKKFVVGDTNTDVRIVMIGFEFVAGGRLSLICSDEIEYLKEA